MIIKTRSKKALIIGVLLSGLLVAGCEGNGNNNDNDTVPVDNGEQNEEETVNERVAAAYEMAEELGKTKGFNEEITEKLLEIEGILNGFALKENGQLDIHLLYPKDIEPEEINDIDQELFDMIGENYPDKRINNIGGTYAD